MSDNLTTLKNKIKTNDCSGLFLLYGDEDFTKHHYIEMLKKSILDDMTIDFNFVKFDSNNINLDTINESFESYPVMSEKKLILFKDSNIFKAPNQEIKDFFEKRLKDVPDYLCVVFDEKLLDKRSALYKNIAKNGLEVEFKYLSENELVEWAQRAIKSHNKKIDKDDATYLVSLCDDGLINLKTEIDKLVNYSYNQITKSDIDIVVSKSLQTIVFDLTDAIMLSNYKKAISVLSDLKTSKEEPFKILYLLFSTFEKLLTTKCMQDHGKSQANIASRLGLKPFIVKKYADSATHFSEGFLKNNISRIAEIDMEIKSGLKNSWVALEQYVLNLLL